MPGPSLDRGAEVAATLFPALCIKGDADMVKLFLDRGVDASAALQLADGETSAFLSACNSGQAAIVSLILDHDAHTTSTEALQAAFMAACNNEHVDVLAVLVRHGKQPGTRSLVSNRTNRFARGCLRMQL